MNSNRLIPAARHDLSSIWEYTAERWDAGQAEVYIGELRVAIKRVASQPEYGRACDDIRHGYRRYSVGSYLIFYVEAATGIDVIRILHQRMDPTRYL